MVSTLSNTARSIMLGFILAAASFVPSNALAHEYKAGPIVIGHPWSRATMPNAKVAAGYLTLSNPGPEADRLIAASADLASKTEIHEMKVDAAGIMTMRPMEGLEVPVNGEVKLAPGGIHLMFMDLKARPKEGEKFPGTLTFEKAGTVAVEFAVESAEPGSEADHSSH